MDLEIRKLETHDLFTVATILGKCGEEATKVISQIGEGKSATAIGLAFLAVVLKHAESDIKKWMASLIGKSVEEFDKLPFDTPLAIVEKLAKTEDIKGFFMRARKLSGVFSGTKQT